LRLLVVEDDPDLNRQLVTALGEAGYAVDTAFDGEEGHFLGDTEPYDAVVLDIGLPKKDGLSVLEQWRRDDRKMPVLILTARERWSDKVAGMDAGADDYVASSASAAFRRSRHQRDGMWVSSSRHQGRAGHGRGASDQAHLA
jgi:two-component system OmpR family response regulator